MNISAYLILTVLGVIVGTVIGMTVARRRHKKSNSDTAKMEFSKKLLYANFSVVYIVIIFTLMIVWRTGDTSPLSYLIPSTFTLASVANGYYFWKAKAENIIKASKTTELEIIDKIKGDDNNEFYS